MNTYKNIEKLINNLCINDEIKQELRVQLFEEVGEKTWNKYELTTIMFEENDIADKYFLQDTKEHNEVREIQHAIINFFS